MGNKDHAWHYLNNFLEVFFKIYLFFHILIYFIYR